MTRGPGQGEALLVWLVWGITAVVVATTYARVDPAELYHVSGDGLAGGLGRALVMVNYPLAFVALPLALVAIAALPPRAWWIGAPAMALCVLTAFVVDQDDLDARWSNVLPAIGVALTLGLTVAAARRAGVSLAPRLAWDPIRVVVAAVVVVVSLPWYAADLGFHFPGDFFMGEELLEEADGSVLAAVHLGQHHGQNGAMMLLSALLLSRARIEPSRHGVATAGAIGLLAAYGAVNMVQDAWNEQIWKRGWVDVSIPSAVVPGITTIWLVVIGLAVLLALAFRAERVKT